MGVEFSWGSRRLILIILFTGVGLGTFVLTDEPILEPPRLLKEALGKEGIEKEGVFDVLNIGETREY